MALQHSIQRKLDNKELDAVMEHYDPDIIYVGPAFERMIVGREALKEAFGRHFQNLQHTLTNLGEIRIRHLSDGGFVVNCLVEGKAIVYLSEGHFKGRLTRIFAISENKPLIISEHFSLIS